LLETFSRTWQRPPTEAEFTGLIDGRVKEEVFYREGVKMGLDKDDTIVRRRMQQRMEFLLEPSAEELTPKEGELEDYLKAHADKFRAPEKLMFRQIFFDSSGSTDGAVGRAKEARAMLVAESSASEEAFAGDPTLLPGSMDLTDADIVATTFGKEFVEGLQSAPHGQWVGPVNSPFGIHLVFVERKVAGHTPLLEDVKAEVRLDWESARRKEIANKRYADMRKQYDVRVVGPSDTATAPIKTSGVR
jgi:parvulin-like peptidyl-prolyl isomerase